MWSVNVRPKTSSLSFGRGFGFVDLAELQNDGGDDIRWRISRRRRSR